MTDFPEHRLGFLRKKLAALDANAGRRDVRYYLNILYTTGGTAATVMAVANYGRRWWEERRKSRSLDYKKPD